MEVSAIRAGILLGLLLCGQCFAQTAAQLRTAIHESLAADRLDEAAVLLERYLEVRPDDGAMHYNAACVLGRLGEIDAAETALLDSVKAGFLDFSHMRRDPDLDPLRDGKIYHALMAASEAADPLLADRRVKKWQTSMGDAPHRIEHDPDRRLDYITSLDDAAHDDLRRRVETQADRLIGWLFAAPLRYRVLIAIPTAERLAELVPDAHAQGRYHHQFHELVSAPGGVALSHELAHVYHHNHMDHLGQEHPIWIQEGLAALFEAYTVDDDGAFTFERNDRDRIVRHFMEGSEGLPSLAQLMTMTAGDFRRNPVAHYGQARSLLRFLAAQDRLETWYAIYTDRFREDPTGRAAVEAAFDLSLNEIERRWRAWVMAVEVSQSRRLAVRPPEPQRPLLRPEPAIANAPLASPSPAARLHREARALAAVGRHHEAIARLRQLLAIEPEHADALYDLGLSCVMTGDLESARDVHDTLAGIDPSLASLLGNLVVRP